jgi:hypothetical protein
MTDTFSGAKYEETTKHAHVRITGISGKSNSQRFQNLLHISVLPVFTSRLRNYQKWRLPYRRALAWLTTRKQIHAPVFRGRVREQVCVPPLPLDIHELKLRITAANETFDRNMGWAALQTGHLSGHEWSKHYASLGYAKLPEFVIRMALVTAV